MRSKPILFCVFLSMVFLTMVSININIHPILPFKVPFSSLTEEVKKQVTCLAENIYFEAANEPLEGKKAVAFVTFNRLKTGNYADSICGVVTQKSSGVCQFSWYCDGNFVNKRLTIKSTPLYNDILQLSTYLVLNHDKIEDNTNGSTYYHAKYVNPEWKLKKETQIGQHIFYKRNGDEIDRRKGII